MIVGNELGLGFGTRGLDFDFGSRISYWIWSDHHIALLYCNSVHNAGRTLVGIVFCTGRQVGNVAPRRMVYQAGRMLNYACSNILTRRRFGSSYSILLGCQRSFNVSIGLDEASCSGAGGLARINSALSALSARRPFLGVK